MRPAAPSTDAAGQPEDVDTGFGRCRAIIRPLEFLLARPDYRTTSARIPIDASSGWPAAVTLVLPGLIRCARPARSNAASDRADHARHQLCRPAGGGGDRRLSPPTSYRTSSSGSPARRLTRRRTVSSDILARRSRIRSSSFGARRVPARPPDRRGGRKRGKSSASRAASRARRPPGLARAAASAARNLGLFEDRDDRVAFDAFRSAMTRETTASDHRPPGRRSPRGRAGRPGAAPARARRCPSHRLRRGPGWRRRCDRPRASRTSRSVSGSWRAIR